MTAAKNDFLKLIRNRFKFRMFLLAKLPVAFFSGLRIVQANDQLCTVSVPYKWLTKNPFRSTYFASLAMAAELSTGVLAMANVYKSKPAVSMLVTNLEAVYHKKATGKTFFTCSDGAAFEKTIQAAVDTNTSHVFKAISTGVDDMGNTIATFTISWSFKVKPQ